MISDKRLDELIEEPIIDVFEYNVGRDVLENLKDLQSALEELKERRAEQFTQPYAKIFDYDLITEENETEFVIRQVSAIEYPNGHHTNTIIWYNGFKSESFELITKEEAEHEK